MLFSVKDNVYILDNVDHAQWKPGSPWDSSWKLSVNLYISAAADVVDIVEIFIKVSQSKCLHRGLTYVIMILKAF